ncbi:MAG: methyltransferase domain-containing protein [Gammaproteobacteria bacterium]|nr:methyltransferase domain-containing protein [Gammaproteobacteria bacterium]
MSTATPAPKNDTLVQVFFYLTIMTLHKQIQRATQRAAPHYHKRAQLPYTLAQRLLEKWEQICQLNTRPLPLLTQPHTLLDIGCGTGGLLDQLQTCFPHTQCFGVDLSLAMLEQHPAHTLCADAHHLPFPDHSIDVIFSVLMLEWSPHLPTLLQEFKRVLSPNGHFFFATLGPGTLMELRQTWQKIDAHPHINYFTDMHDLGDMLLKLKFETPIVTREDITCLYRHVSSLLKELKQLGSVKMSDNIQRTFTQKSLLQALETHYPQNNEHFYPATFEAIYGYAAGSTHHPEDEARGITRVPIQKVFKKKHS